MLVRHEVEDYDEWEDQFESEVDDRSRKGSEGAEVFVTTEDPNELVVLTEWDSIEDAESYAQESVDPEKIEEAGITGEIEVVELEEIASYDA